MSNDVHVMVDIETLSTGPNALILSIGAVSFRPHDDGLLSTFELNIDPASSEALGFEINASTVMWWMQQSEEARAVFKEGTVPIKEALSRFSAWYPAEAPLWGNGATFDNVILANAYKRCGMTPPWRFTKDRCFRTLKNLFPTPVPNDLVPNMTGHRALHDAMWQARCMQVIWVNAGLR